MQAGQQQLPTALVGATERLQALVDQMQSDAAGQAAERRQLMGEVMALRTKLNTTSGEAIALKEELMAEKKEKLALSKQLVDAQLNGTESTAESQETIHKLEREKLAADDVLRQHTLVGANGGRLKSTRASLEAAETEKRRLETQKTALQAELHLLQESTRWREREDELNMQLLNAANGQTAAEAEAKELKAKLENGTAEAARRPRSCGAARLG